MAAVKIDGLRDGSAMHIETKIGEVLDAYAVEEATGHDRMIEIGTQLAYALGLAFKQNDEARCRVDFHDETPKATR